MNSGCIIITTYTCYQCHPTPAWTGQASLAQLQRFPRKLNPVNFMRNNEKFAISFGKTIWKHFKPVRSVQVQLFDWHAEQPLRHLQYIKSSIKQDSTINTHSSTNPLILHALGSISEHKAVIKFSNTPIPVTFIPAIAGDAIKNFSQIPVSLKSFTHEWSSCVTKDCSASRNSVQFSEHKLKLISPVVFIQHAIIRSFIIQSTLIKIFFK